MGPWDPRGRRDEDALSLPPAPGYKLVRVARGCAARVWPPGVAVAAGPRPADRVCVRPHGSLHRLGAAHAAGPPVPWGCAVVSPPSLCGWAPGPSSAVPPGPLEPPRQEKRDLHLPPHVRGAQTPLRARQPLCNGERLSESILPPGGIFVCSKDKRFLRPVVPSGAHAPGGNLVFKGAIRE